MIKTFICHNIEWFDGDVCVGCEAATEERDRIIGYLTGKGVFRAAMFYPGIVAKAEFLDDTNTWQYKTIDLPLDLGAGEVSKKCVDCGEPTNDVLCPECGNEFFKEMN